MTTRLSPDRYFGFGDTGGMCCKHRVLVAKGESCPKCVPTDEEEVDRDEEETDEEADSA